MREFSQFGDASALLSQYQESRNAMRLLEEAPDRVGYRLKDRVSDIAMLADA